MEITNELQKFNVTDAAIAELSGKYLCLKINGIEDSKGFKVVHEARMDIKRRRVDVEKTRKELKEDALRYGQAVDKEAKRITALLAPIEEYLSSEEQKVEDEKARIKAEAEEKERARIQIRIDTLCAFGCQFNGRAYVILGVSVPADQVPKFTDSEFIATCQQIQEKIDAEEARKVAEATAKKAEEDRLAKIAAEQEAERKRLAEIERKQREDAERIKREQEEKARALKAEEDRIEGVKRALEENKRREEEKARREKELEEARKEAEKKAIREAEEKAKREAEEKAEAERKAQEEAARQEALKPDKDKLLAFADSVELHPLPEVGEGAAWIVSDAKAHLTKLANIIRKNTRSL